MRRRRNSDWDDLPPMFAAPPPSSTFSLAPTSPPSSRVTIRLAAPPRQHAEIAAALDVLSHAGDAAEAVAAGRRIDEQGHLLVLPDMSAACLVRHAAWRLAGDDAQPFRVRAGALAIEKAMDAQTDGRATACLAREVTAIRRAAGTAYLIGDAVKVDRRKLMGPPLLGTDVPITPEMDPEGIQAFLRHEVPGIFMREHEAAWNEFMGGGWRNDPDVQEMIREGCSGCARGVCKDIEDGAYERGFAVGMARVAEELQRIGLEAKAIGDEADLSQPWKVFFRNPHSPFAGAFGDMAMIQAMFLPPEEYLRAHYGGPFAVNAMSMMGMDDDEFDEIMRVGFIR